LVATALYWQAGRKDGRQGGYHGWMAENSLVLVFSTITVGDTFSSDETY
jgi:hypothetical protein